MAVIKTREIHKGTKFWNLYQKMGNTTTVAPSLLVTTITVIAVKPLAFEAFTDESQHGSWRLACPTCPAPPPPPSRDLARPMARQRLREVLRSNALRGYPIWGFQKFGALFRSPYHKNHSILVHFGGPHFWELPKVHLGTSSTYLDLQSTQQTGP